MMSWSQRQVFDLPALFLNRIFRKRFFRAVRTKHQTAQKKENGSTPWGRDRHSQ